MRELVVLGTGSQVASRERNQNGYFLRWDADGFLFDPGEGTQRQLLYAGLPAGALLATGRFGELRVSRLDHPVESFGYQLVEPEGRRMLPDRLARHGISGPAVGRLQETGSFDVAGRTVTLEEVSEARPGQRFAFVMDTRLCDGVLELADGADLLVIESTYLSAEAELAARFGHLTARQAARVARECGVASWC